MDWKRLNKGLCSVLLRTPEMMALLCLSLHLEAPGVFLYYSGLGIKTADFPTKKESMIFSNTS